MTPRIITADVARELLHGATEGPWEVGVASSWQGSVRVETEMYVRRPGDNVALAAQVIDPRTEEISESTARLLAAAPDLAHTVVAQAAEIERLTRALHDAAYSLGCADYDDVCAAVSDAIDEAEKRERESVDEANALRMERAALRAIVDGRTAPPTEAEIAAHEAAGGRWRSIVPGEFILSTGDGDAEDARQTSAVQRANEPIIMRAGVRWWAIDAQGRCCAWPVVAEASR